MVDIASVSAALTSLKAATDIAKLIKDSGSSLESAEVKLKVADLVSALADAKVEVAEIQALLLERDEVIKDLEERLSLKGALEWDKPYYWLDTDGQKDGPFCQTCYDERQKLIRLQGGGKNSWKCNACKSLFRDKNYVSPNISSTFR